MIYIGIDPGMDGGLAAIGSAGCTTIAMPTIAGTEKGTKRMLDVPAIITWFKSTIAIPEQVNNTLVIIEAVSAMPQQGVTSMFSFGTTYGMLQGVVLTLGLPMLKVRPQAWKKLILAGTQKDKAAAIQYVRQRYPELSLRVTARCTTDHDGMADAVCLAEYGQRIGGHNDSTTKAG